MYKGILTGLGSRAASWLHAARKHPETELVAFVEPYEPNRQRAIENDHYKVPADRIFPTLKEAIAASDADFVLDVTPPKVHRAVAEEAFAAGLHVFGEKPLSDNFADARVVVEAGRKAGLRHMVAQNYRFMPIPRTLDALVQADTIGRIGQLDMRFYMNWADIPGSHYVTQPYMLINDMMVHHFDLIRYVLKAEPQAVTAITWNQPWGWHQGDAAHAIVFEFPEGLRVTHIALGCSIGQTTTYVGDWRLEGTKGSLSVEGQTLRHVHKHRAVEKIDREIPINEVPEGPQAMLSEFFQSIRENRDPECSAADNLNSIAMVFAAIKSAEEGRRVTLDELEPATTT